MGRDELLGFLRQPNLPNYGLSGFESSKQAVTYVGLNPRQHRFGNSAAKIGVRRLRRALVWEAFRSGIASDGSIASRRVGKA